MSPEPTVLPHITLFVQKPFHTLPNNFGIWKKYCCHPSYNPNMFLSAKDLYCPHTSTIVTERVHEEEESTYTNKSTRLLVDWQNTSSSAKSNNEITHLVHNVILHPDFQLDEVQTFNTAQENQKADIAKAKSPVLQGFQHADIQINILSGNKDLSPSLFTILGLYFHKLTILIKDAFKSPLSSMFHFTPFKMYHTQPDGTNKCVFSEIYNSDIF